jgi:hypothetical protein
VFIILKSKGAAVDELVKLISTTHKRIEKGAPVWGSVFTAKAAEIQGDSDEFVSQAELEFL